MGPKNPYQSIGLPKRAIGVRFSANLANLPEDYRDSAPFLNMIRNQLGIKARRRTVPNSCEVV
jgi:hypothetical protein